jgi:hypothetical protein
VIFAALLLIAFVGTLVLSRTDWGRERVRRFVLGQLQGMVHGQITMGRVSGNLLTGATIESFAIRDTAGQVFFATERLSARYRILDLLTRKFDLRNVYLERPLIVLDKLPGGKWNYQRIFLPSDTTEPRSVRRKGFPWIVLHNLTLADARFIMRTPWKPDSTLSRAAQDSSIREALSGKKRVMVVRADTGFQKVVELRELTARVPLLRIKQPGYKDRLAQITSLQQRFGVVERRGSENAGVIAARRWSLRLHDRRHDDRGTRPTGGAGRFPVGDAEVPVGGRWAAGLPARVARYHAGVLRQQRGRPHAGRSPRG